MKDRLLHSAFSSMVTLAVVGLLAACGADGARGSGDPTDPTDAGAPDGASEAGRSASERDAADEDGELPEEEESDDPTKDLPTDDEGCLTYAAAQQVCGSASDGAVCDHALDCGATTNAGECSINCEMWSTVECFTPADAKCLLDAAASKSCGALEKCAWKL